MSAVLLCGQTASGLAARIAAFIFAFLVCALPLRAQLILYEVPNPWSYEWVSALTGDVNSTLEIRGLGRAEIGVENPDFFGEVIIRGAELALSYDGMLQKAKAFRIEKGGTLFLDNRWGTAFSRIAPATITLNAGTLHLHGDHYGSLTQHLGQVIFEGGANTLYIEHEIYWSTWPIEFTAFVMASLSVDLMSTGATLNLTGNRSFGTGTDNDSIRFQIGDGTSGGEGPYDDFIGKAMPMATVKGEDWMTAVRQGGALYFVAFDDYETSWNSDDWTSSSHVLVDGTSSQYVDLWGQSREIGSLKLANGGGLYLGADSANRRLTFPGILTTDNGDNWIEGNGTLSFQYAHIYSPELRFAGSSGLGTNNLIKTGPGTLRFAAATSWHSARNLSIHQGRVYLQSGKLESRNIIVGDGTGEDILELPANSTQPIEGMSSGGDDPTPLVNITLRGSPYENPWESNAAVLRFGGSTEQQFHEFKVEGRGIIDFVNGTAGAPNRLVIEEFFLADDATLFIHNWEDQADLLLVRYTPSNIARINADFLARIKFEGYTDPAVWVPWSGDLWEIRPMPEPSTYGAIFGIVGLGLWGWKKRKRASVPNA